MKDILNDPIKGYEFTRQIECIEHEHAMKKCYVWEDTNSEILSVLVLQ